MWYTLPLLYFVIQIEKNNTMKVILIISNKFVILFYYVSFEFN